MCYRDLKKDVKEQYGVTLTKIRAIGFSAMMHGYLAFDKAGELLVPFRTWRNTITEEAAAALTKEFSYNIPQRWSIAHLYQAMLNKEEHVKDIAFFTTLAGFIHWKLTGEKVLGVGDASGMFPIDSNTKDYDAAMLDKFDALAEPYGFDWSLRDILPKVLVAGENAGTLTAEGARLLDTDGELEAGIPVCPPEGDAGTGMAATNSVAVRTGNVSAGTSVFAMIVLEKALKNVHTEIDLVTTPSGEAVAMAHCNNCTSDLNAWVNLFEEFANSFGMKIDKNELFSVLYNKALEGDADCGGLLAYNYFSGEGITAFDEGRPLFARTPDAKFNLANFMRVHLFTALGALKDGLDILLKEEGVQIDKMYGHGGLFKTPVVGQRIMAAAIDTPVSVMETAGDDVIKVEIPTYLLKCIKKKTEIDTVVSAVDLAIEEFSLEFAKKLDEIKDFKTCQYAIVENYVIPELYHIDLDRIDFSPVKDLLSIRFCNGFDDSRFLKANLKSVKNHKDEFYACLYLIRMKDLPAKIEWLMNDF